MKPIILMGANSEADEWTLKKIWENPSWIAEYKFDGARYQALIGSNNEVRIFSRRIWVERTGNLPHIVEEIKKLNLPAGTILDGEIIHPQTGEGQKACSQVTSIMNSDPPHAIGVQNKVGYVHYEIFDVPFFAGNPLKATLIERKNLLKWDYFSGKKFKFIEFVEGVVEDKKKYFDDVVAKGGEGIILKNLDSVYAIGTTDQIKNGSWIKVKKTHTYDCVVIGGVEGEGKNKGILGALKIAQFRNGVLTDVGKVSGMSDKQRREWWQKITANADKTFILEGKKHIVMKPTAYWQIEIEAQEQAKNAYRFPRFVRERNDKKADECIWAESKVKEE